MCSHFAHMRGMCTTEQRQWEASDVILACALPLLWSPVSLSVSLATGRHVFRSGLIHVLQIEDANVLRLDLQDV